MSLWLNFFYLPVIIHNLNIVSDAGSPAEANAPQLVDANAVLSPLYRISRIVDTAWQTSSSSSVEMVSILDFNLCFPTARI